MTNKEKLKSYKGMVQTIKRLEKMQDIENTDEIGEEILQLRKRCKVITDAIDEIEDVTLRNVLYYCYILGYTQEETAEEMGYSKRHITRLKCKGLDLIEFEE